MAESQQEYIKRKQKETGDFSLGSRGKFASEWTAGQAKKSTAEKTEPPAVKPASKGTAGQQAAGMATPSHAPKKTYTNAPMGKAGEVNVGDTGTGDFERTYGRRPSESEASWWKGLTPEKRAAETKKRAPKK